MGSGALTIRSVQYARSSAKRSEARYAVSASISAVSGTKGVGVGSSPAASAV